MHLGAAILLFLLAQFLLFPAHLLPGSATGRAGVEFAAIVFVAGVPVAITVAALFPELRVLIDIVGRSNNPGRATIVKFLEDRLTSLDDNLKGLRGVGEDFDAIDIATWFRLCFETLRGRYVGTDHHVPSEWRELYEELLLAHRGYVARTGVEDSTRVILSDVTGLRTDRNAHQSEFEWFLEQHKPDILARRLDRSKAQELAEQCGLDTTDLGFWEGELALLFLASPDKRHIRLRMVFPGEPEYKRCADYIRQVERRALPLTHELPVVEAELSHEWERFVVPAIRLRRLEPFLDAILARFGSIPAGDLHILDAACGIGVESVCLLSKGYRLTANEIEDTLREQALAYARENNHPIPAASFPSEDWLNFASHFGQDRFDVVLALGNSVCLLNGRADIQRAIDNFFEVLEPGGILAIDERNFAYITDNWAELVDAGDPWHACRFNQTRDVMYCGSEVRGAPVSRLPDEQRVIFAYARFQGEERAETIGELSMYAFRRGELLEMLRTRFGPQQVEIHCNLNPVASSALDDDADFFTYIATKPQ